ncbi:MAG: DUF2382 domain-containing protein [Candidatus Solibacter sp.]
MAEEIEKQNEREEVIVPVVEEEIDATTRAIKTGAVRVDKHVEKRIRKIETPLLHENVEVRRVPVNRVVDRAPKTQRTGDTVIIPVVEEELVVTKRLVLKEEIHLITHRTRDRAIQEVELNRESAEIRRLDADGRVLETPPKSLVRRRIVGSRTPPSP